ncbi:MAG TPA: MFS transporter [Gemmatimonadales bacterium]|nr:MFS transporter [Gemmatimonadales bacterium]
MTSSGHSARPGRLAGLLGLDRNTGAAALAVFTMALGEHLWRKFLPKYLEALGAPLVAIGAYGSTQDLLDGLYQYPGGWLADRYGRRRALVVFISLAAIGYGVIAWAPAWPIVLVGMLFMMAWSSMASPTLFAVVGDALPRDRRAIGFSVQSILRRVPIAVAATLGGLLIASHGVIEGVRTGLILSILLALLTLLIVSRIRLALPPRNDADARGVWRSFPVPLRRLLLSDIFIRTCEGMVDVFLVLYALDIVGITAPEFGLLIGVQMTTSILCYLPAARLADRIGRKPLVIATFVAFSLFPVAVVLAHSFAGLVLAFVIGGLREVGEPARKALILDLVPDGARARGVGLYYLIRSLAITPAAVTGGLLWKLTPQVPFVLAGAIGLVGTAVFAVTVEERHAA